MSNNENILIIDDEPINVSIMQSELEDAGYDLLIASNGLQGWEMLKKHSHAISVVLLDRMMPGMNGIEFMKRLKQDESVRNIPVIMQTGAAESERVIEGIDAGVYYYLTKPYSTELLLAIVKAAIRDNTYRNAIPFASPITASNHYLIEEATFKIRTLESASELAASLSPFFPNPQTAALGLHELMLNAIEHGNLGIGFTTKSDLLRKQAWLSEVEQRLDAPEYRDKVATLRYRVSDSVIEVQIEDQGEGFDWRQYLNVPQEKLTELHGRGIMIANEIAFDELEYNEQGNCVTARVMRHKDEGTGQKI